MLITESGLFSVRHDQHQHVLTDAELAVVLELGAVDLLAVHECAIRALQVRDDDTGA